MAAAQRRARTAATAETYECHLLTRAGERRLIRWSSHQPAGCRRPARLGAQRRHRRDRGTGAAGRDRAQQRHHGPRAVDRAHVLLDRAAGIVRQPVVGLHLHLFRQSRACVRPQPGRDRRAAGRIHRSLRPSRRPGRHGGGVSRLLRGRGPAFRHLLPPQAARRQLSLHPRLRREARRHRQRRHGAGRHVAGRDPAAGRRRHAARERDQAPARAPPRQARLLDLRPGGGGGRRRRPPGVLRRHPGDPGRAGRGAQRRHHQPADRHGASRGPRAHPHRMARLHGFGRDRLDVRLPPGARRRRDPRRQRVGGESDERPWPGGPGHRRRAGHHRPQAQRAGDRAQRDAAAPRPPPVARRLLGVGAARCRAVLRPRLAACLERVRGHPGCEAGGGSARGDRTRRQVRASGRPRSPP